MELLAEMIFVCEEIDPINLCHRARENGFGDGAHLCHGGDGRVLQLCQQHPGLDSCFAGSGTWSDRLDVEAALNSGIAQQSIQCRSPGPVQGSKISGVVVFYGPSKVVRRVTLEQL